MYQDSPPFPVFRALSRSLHRHSFIYKVNNLKSSDTPHLIFNNPLKKSKYLFLISCLSIPKRRKFLLLGKYRTENPNCLGCVCVLNNNTYTLLLLCNNVLNCDPRIIFIIESHFNTLLHNSSVIGMFW